MKSCYCVHPRPIIVMYCTLYTLYNKYNLICKIKNDDSGRRSCAVKNSWIDKLAGILCAVPVLSSSIKVTVSYEINGGFPTTI